MVESADRVLRLLRAFVPAERDASLGDLAGRVALPKSTVHRLLSTLIEHEVVERDPSTRRYRLGIRLFELGSATIHERGLYSAADPVLAELSVKTEETCHLAVLSGLEAVYVHKVDGSSSFRMSSRIGGRAPCHATSIGKVLLAWSGRDVLARYREAPLQSYTANTITSFNALDAELAAVRSRGYGVDLEELEDGLLCVAAPVRDHSGAVIAALGIAGPRRRLGGDRLPALAPLVVDAAARVSRNLGFVKRFHSSTPPRADRRQAAVGRT